MIDFKEIKSAAKEQIKGNILTFLGLTIVVAIILQASVVVAIGPLLLTGAFELGMALFAMEIVNTKKGNFNTGFKGFSQFGSAFVATLLITIYTLLWSCLFVIPGIIASFRYSMTYYILAENPDMSGSEAIKKSKEMMVGHKWELFCLSFSFIGWILLCLITFGLAAIYVNPYMEVTFANYYYKLKGESETTTTTKPAVEE